MKIGTCGFAVARKKYYSKFRVVEVQKTFYSPLKESLAEKWRKEAPENFEFTVKAPQTITHEMKSPTYRRYKGPPGDFGRFKVNEDTMASWEHFVKIAKILNSKVIIFQSPPSFSERDENVKNLIDFFSSIERDFIYGWEPRGRWREETIRKICAELNIIHVVDPFKSRKLHGSFSYYRLHGITGYNYRFTDGDLLKLRSVVKKGDYVMFNNTNMWEDAQRFLSIFRDYTVT